LAIISVIKQMSFRLASKNR